MTEPRRRQASSNTGILPEHRWWCWSTFIFVVLLQALPTIHGSRRCSASIVLSHRDRGGFLSLPHRLGTIVTTSSSSSSDSIPLVYRLRGGAAADVEEEEDDEEDDDEEEDEEEEEEEEGSIDSLSAFDSSFDKLGETLAENIATADDGDFAEETLVNRAIAGWNKTPPLTKAYLSASMAATAFGYLMNKNQFPKCLGLESYWPIVTKLQIWRPFTAFLNIGPFGIGYFLTAHFVWTYMSFLERLHHDRPFDFWIMILFGQLSMVIGYPILKLNPKFLGHNLSTFLVYVWSRYNEGMPVNMFELFQTRAEMLPWAFLFQTFLLEGELPILDFLGIVFGHVYYHLKKVGLLRAPKVLVDWYQGDSPYSRALRRKYKDISADFEIV